MYRFVFHRKMFFWVPVFLCSKAVTTVKSGVDQPPCSLRFFIVWMLFFLFYSFDYYSLHFSSWCFSGFFLSRLLSLFTSMHCHMWLNFSCEITLVCKNPSWSLSVVLMSSFFPNYMFAKRNINHPPFCY